MHLKTQYCRIHSSSICLPNSEFTNLWPGSSNQFLALWPPLGAAKVEGVGCGQHCSLLLQECPPHWCWNARSRNTLCFPLSVLTEPEVLQEMEDTVGLWPRQQSTGRWCPWRTGMYLHSSNLLWILFVRVRGRNDVKITSLKHHLHPVMLWSKVSPKIQHQGPNRYESLDVIFSMFYYIKKKNCSE